MCKESQPELLALPTTEGNFFINNSLVYTTVDAIRMISSYISNYYLHRMPTAEIKECGSIAPDIFDPNKDIS